MKKILSILAVVLLAATSAFSQNPSPGIFNYQGVARNSVGNVLVNKLITLRLTIRDGAAAGPLLYQESRNVTTNPFGLFNVQVGSPGGSNVTGTVAGINLGAPTSNKFIQVEIDPNGGTTFINIGTAQIASVPYSLYSSLSNDLVLPFLKTQADAGTLFRINNSGTGISGAIMGVTQSNANNAWGVHGRVDNTSPGSFSSGLLGTNLSTTGLGIGVTGSQNGSGWGVYGTTPSGIGVNGVTTSGTGVSGSSTSGNGVNGASTSGIGGNFSSTTGRALQTAGGVRLTGINEAANRILATVPGNGDATWQSPAAVGIVTGSGTLNFVPKWTPNGTNLGNSLMFDDGTSVNVGTTTPDNATMLLTGGAVPALRIKNATSAAVVGGIYLGPFANNDIYFGTNENTAIRMFTNGTQNATLLNNGNFGIGNVAPAARLQVDNAGTNGTGLINQTGATNTNSALIVSKTNATHNGFLDATAFVQRSTGATTFLGGAAFPSAIKGGSTGIGVQGSSPLIGTVGITTGITASSIGLYGLATAVGGYALFTNGRVQISGQNAGLNRILSSDAVGNATWQDPAAIGVVTGSGTLNYVPKWTPNGTNLGNSQIRDDGTRVSVGNPAFNDPNSMNIFSTSATGADASLQIGSNSDFFGMYNENGTGKLHFTANNASIVAGVKIMTLDDDGVNGVGIGTVNPTAKLHALSVPTTGGSDAVLGESNSTDASAVAVRGVITSTSPGGFSAGVRGINNGTGGSGIGVYGSQNGSGWGVYGTTPGGIGVRGTSNTGIGVYGATNNNYSGYFFNGNASNGFATLIGTTNGIGPAVQGIATGTGVAGWFDTYNPANNQPAVYGSTDGTGNAGFFWNNNVANTTASLVGTNPSANIGAWGIRATSLTGTGYPGEATHAALVAQTSTGVGIVTSSTGNFGLRAGALTTDAIYAETYSNTGNTAIRGAGLFANSFGVVGNAAAGTGAGGYFTGGTTALRTLGGLQLTGINEGVNRILTTTSGTGQATWEDAATAGIVSGSGTLNFIPKWTPNGTTLGNSQVFDNGANVGIGTITPTAKFDVVNTGINVSASVIQNNAANTSRALNVFNANVSNVVPGNTALWVRRGAPAGIEWFWGSEPVAITGVSSTGPGVQGSSSTNVGVVGETNSGVGVYAFSGTPAGYALQTYGQVQITGQGAAAGNVLTSDAAGNATWQDATATRIAFAVRGLTSAVSIPFFAFTPITQWATVDYEEGSIGNYNAGTGEYTVPKTGKYNINTQLTYNQPGASGSGYASASIFVNGANTNNSFSNMTTANAFSGVTFSGDLSLNAGDLVRIQTFHNTSGSVTLNNSSNTLSTWSIHLIK